LHLCIFTPGQAKEVSINKKGWQNEKKPFTFTCLLKYLFSDLLGTGFLTRLATIPLFIIIFIAYITPKWPLLADKWFWVIDYEIIY
jgi:uncharacterized membrane protein YphA (DoxX/SURF4 family)